MKASIKTASIKPVPELSKQEIAAVSGGMKRPIYGPAPRP